MPNFQQLQFHDWAFDANFSIARNCNRPPVSFTPQEQAVLARLAPHPGQLISREQLLDALDPHCDGIGARSADFIVNRLRRKLRDDARNPRFIATRYGEGYVWLVKGRPIDQDQSLLLLESIYGLTRLQHPGVASAAMRALANQLGERLQWRCVLPPGLGLTPAMAPGKRDARFHMDVSLIDDVDHLHVAIGIRDGRSGQPLMSLTVHPPIGHAIDAMTDFAASLVTRLWSLLMLEERDPAGPTEQPLHVRAHEAALLLTRSPQYWIEMEAEIVRARQGSSQDARLGILWAANRHARLLSSFGDDEATTTRLLTEYENCIEAEVLQALPGIEDAPAYQLTAAMLLLTLAREHDDLAESLIEKAFWNGAPFASVFCLRARLSMCRGELQQSVAHLDRALEMAVAGSEFHVYLLVLKLKAVIAGGNRAAADAVERALFAAKPRTALDIGLQAAAPDAPLSQPLQQALLSLGLQRVRQLLRQHYCVVVRPMKLREHQVQLMLGPVAHARRLFGDAVLAPNIATALPELAVRGLPLRAEAAKVAIRSV